MIKTTSMIEGYFPKVSTDYLRVELELRKRRNPQYSIRAFARDLNLSPSHLSEFLSGKAAISAKKATDLSLRLKLSQDQVDHWNDLIALASKGKVRKQKAKLRVLKRIKENKSQVSLDVFTAISDWYHFAILTFFEMNPKISDEELARHLRISEKQVHVAIKRLKSLKLLEKNKDGYKPISNSTFAGDADSSAAIRESHRQVLEKATEALELFGVDERISQSLFFSIPKKNLKKMQESLKQKVLETISEFSDEGEAHPDDSIQTLTWHLFPLQEKS